VGRRIKEQGWRGWSQLWYIYKKFCKCNNVPPIQQ
jgi:hypothetical protein